jgi:hypothetical protein
MAKLSLEALRKRLPVGHEFTGEFVGKVNRQRCKPEEVVMRRRVVANTTKELSCMLLDGPRAGETSTLPWKFTVLSGKERLNRSITADERDGSIFLTMNDDEFLKLTGV